MTDSEQHNLFFSRAVCFAMALIVLPVGGTVGAPKQQSNLPEGSVSCRRNYLDLFWATAELQFNDEKLVGVLWSSTTQTGHECTVAYGSLRKDDSTEGEAFSLHLGEGYKDWYLLEPPKGFCVVHINRSGQKFTIQEAYPGACHKHCGANGHFETTVLDLRSKNCGIPRLDKRGVTNKK
jgi:hypothetical protein